jgi:DNA recombination protein RmuC
MSDPLVLALIGAFIGGAAIALLFLMRQMRLVGETARLRAELAMAERSVGEQQARLTEAQTQLRDSFAALSKDALRENRQDFLHNADVVLQPVRETLAKVQAQLTEVDKAREGSFRAVSTQLQSLVTSEQQLREAAEGLSRSLSSPNVRGEWGQIQLRRIVELAGMLEQCDFVERESLTTEDGSRQTPDLVVRLPGNSSIVVDSKVPIDGYRKSIAAADDRERNVHLCAHARQVKEHIRALGSKEYWKQFESSPEFVVMFLPLEPLLGAAFEQDGSILEYAASLRVIPATPMTLLALLKAVGYGWQQQVLAKNAEDIQMLGRELYERLGTMVGHLESVGRNIRQAGESYNNFVGSLEQKVLPGARRFKDLGVTSARELEMPETVNVSLRRVKKEELIAEPDASDERVLPLPYLRRQRD